MEKLWKIEVSLLSLKNKEDLKERGDRDCLSLEPTCSFSSLLAFHGFYYMPLYDFRLFLSEEHNAIICRDLILYYHIVCMSCEDGTEEAL